MKREFIMRGFAAGRSGDRRIYSSERVVGVSLLWGSLGLPSGLPSEFSEVNRCWRLPICLSCVLRFISGCGVLVR